MPEPFRTLLTVGIVLTGLGLILRLYGESAHRPVTLYGLGTAGIGLTGAILVTLAN
ncbi:hypothetical protein ABR737_01545 [Streptomyces sp. Edi2]|uniref:hypothetical protein n=1 Tax=Streptomyces sp. Edi2 TaxID=3162528 RepID=UPI0033057CD8